jgi:cyclohexadieny/prephenate dehydrogenase
MADDRRRLTLAGAAPATARPPLVFDKIGVVGLDAVGGAIALACRHAWPSALVIGMDANDVLDRAMVRHLVDVGADDPGIVGGAGLVILAAPPGRNPALLARLVERLEQPVVLTDVLGTRRAVLETAAPLPPHIAFVSGHPLLGTETDAGDAAQPGLLANRPWLLMPEGAEPAVDRLVAFVEALGAKPHRLTADEHDRLLAFLHASGETVDALFSTNRWREVVRP